MRINSITVNDKVIDIGQITVLVGPNNSGKSRTLLDIKEIFEYGYSRKRILIQRLEFQRISWEEFTRGLNIKQSQNIENHSATGLSMSLNGAESSSFRLEYLQTALQRLNDQGVQYIIGTRIGCLKLTMLDSNLRLSLSSQQDIRGPSDIPRNILEQLHENPELHEPLNDAFKRAFDHEITLDPNQLGRIVFRIAHKFREIPGDRNEARAILSQHECLDDQGDGFKSFVGVILGIVISEGRIVLIDEPEAFLHPTQARVLGEWIANYSKKNSTQIIIATHSSDILDGLLQGNQKTDEDESVDNDNDKKMVILRVNRHENNTNYHQIDAKTTLELGHMPLISSQPVLESIFYKGVIITEGDKDRAIYKTTYNQITDTREHLFVNAVGKHSIKKIVKPLKSANIPVCAILDLDILNNETIFKELLGSFGIENTVIQNLLIKRNEIEDTVEGKEQEKIFEEMKQDVSTFSQHLLKGQFNLEEARREVNKIREKTGRWYQIKKDGIEGFPEEIKQITLELLLELKRYGIFIVPVGELEGWIRVKDIPWFDGASDVILSENIPENLTQFISEIRDYLN